MEGPQKLFLTCPECPERVLVVIPEDPGVRTERSTTCTQGHTVAYDERTALGPVGDKED